MQPGTIFRRDGSHYLGYPFGVVPRLLMTWLATEARRVEDRELALGANLAAFMRDLDLTRDGRTITRLHEQIQRLATARVLVNDRREQGKAIHSITEGFQVASRTSLFWSARDTAPDADSLLPSTITLSAEFYESILRNPVPIDLRALKMLRSQGSGGLPIDLYVWLAYRMFSLREPTLVPWAMLEQQFGSQYTRPRAFKAELLKALPKVRTAWLKLKVAPSEDGLLLLPSPTPIPVRGVSW